MMSKIKYIEPETGGKQIFHWSLDIFTVDLKPNTLLLHRVMGRRFQGSLWSQFRQLIFTFLHFCFKVRLT